MLTRYHTSEDGRREKLAHVYTKDEHGIGRDRLAPEAISVTRRLARAGYQAYVVGGAVRDLLLGKTPKDFDIATDAHPQRVRKLFRRSRIIGKRFQLVHVYVHDSTIEVSTFRARPDETERTSREANNLFGTAAEDVRRRDFTMNALYYDPGREQIVDYVGGYEDIRDRRLRVLNPVEESFSEDPVRMIRAIRYAATTGFGIPQKVSRTIRRMGERIKQCPISRLTEELFKILSCGKAAVCFRYAEEHGLLEYLLPEVASEADEAKLQRMYDGLASVDGRGDSDRPPERPEMIAALCEPFLEVDPEVDLDPELYSKELFRRCKEIVSPLTPPNAEVGKAVQQVMRTHGLRLPKRRRRKPRRRKKPTE